MRLLCFDADKTGANKTPLDSNGNPGISGDYAATISNIDYIYQAEMWVEESLSLDPELVIWELHPDDTIDVIAKWELVNGKPTRG